MTSWTVTLNGTTWTQAAFEGGLGFNYYSNWGAFFSDVAADVATAASNATAAAADAASASSDATAAAASETDASEHATTASRWAKQTGATVVDADTGADSGEYSAKEYAIGTTVSAGSAKDWATTAEDTLVDGSGYSALHHAAKAESWAAGVNLPSAGGQGENFLRQKADESGFEYRTPTQVRSDIAALAAADQTLLKVTEYTEDAGSSSTNSATYVDSGISISYTPESASSTIHVEATYVAEVKDTGLAGGADAIVAGNYRLVDGSGTALSGMSSSGINAAFISAQGVADSTGVFSQSVVVRLSGWIASTGTTARTFKVQHATQNTGWTSKIYSESTRKAHVVVKEYA